MLILDLLDKTKSSSEKAIFDFIDVSMDAYRLIKERLTDEANFGNIIFKDLNEIHARIDMPKRTDLEKDYREKKFVYVISNLQRSPMCSKWGIAKDWKARLNAYQIGDPLRSYKNSLCWKTLCFEKPKSISTNNLIIS